MSNYILYPILELRGYIILSVIILVILTMIVLIMMGRKKDGMKDFKWQGMFLGMSAREMILTALGISQICLIWSIVIFSSEIGMVQIAALAVLCLIKGILGLSFMGLLSEILYGVLAGASLAIENLLLGYMRETGVEVYIGIIWGLLILFIAQYSIYFFYKSLERMLLKHEVARQRLDERRERKEYRRNGKQESEER